jgi:hypothetical protein
MARVRAAGSAAPEPYGGYRRPVLEPHEAELRRLVDATPDITLAELQAELERRLWLRAGLSTILDALRRISLRHKKILEGAEQTDVAGKRHLWRARHRYMDPARFVILDETGTATNAVRRYGRSPSAQRLVAAVPHGHWRTTTFIAGLKHSGVIAPDA